MMTTFKSGLLVGLGFASVVHLVVYMNQSSRSHNEAETEKRSWNLQTKETMTISGNCKCNCPEDFQTERRKMTERYMSSNTSHDNPGLIDVIKKYFLEYPPNAKLKNSHNIFRTTQAAKVEEILKNKTGGFFVESGAFDGETTSNTIYLEQTRNWTGLLIEMDPGLFLQTKGKQRKSVIANACLSPKTHPMKVQIEDQKWATTTRISMDSTKKLNSRDAYCFPFYSFMLAMGRTEIDYFSLDIEGLELEVLKTIPFDKLNIKVLTVEYMHSKSGKDAYIKHMEKNGYKVYADLTKCYHFCRDFVFIKKDLL